MDDDDNQTDPVDSPVPDLMSLFLRMSSNTFPVPPGFSPAQLGRRMEMSATETALQASMQDRAAYKRVISEEGEAELTHSKFVSSEDNEESCPITQEEFMEGDDLTCLPCGHRFKSQAILDWLRKSSPSCPVCRKELKSKEVRNEESDDEQEENTPAPSARALTAVLMSREAIRQRRMQSIRHRLSRHLHLVRSAQMPSPTLEFSIPERVNVLHEINNNIQAAYEEEDSVDLQAAIMASIAAESNEVEEEDTVIESTMFGTLFSDA